MYVYTRKPPLNFGSLLESSDLYQDPTIPPPPTWPHNIHRLDRHENLARDVSMDKEVSVKFWKLFSERRPLPRPDNTQLTFWLDESAFKSFSKFSHHRHRFTSIVQVLHTLVGVCILQVLLFLLNFVFGFHEKSFNYYLIFFLLNRIIIMDEF